MAQFPVNPVDGNRGDELAGNLPFRDLERLLEHGTTAVTRGELADALRHVDRAWRQAPSNLSIAGLLGRLLVAHGEYRTALRHFAKLAEREADPEIEAGVIEAALHCGDSATAMLRLGEALRRFAVAPNGLLAKAAHRVITASARGCGWIGVGPDLDIVGAVSGVAEGSTIELRNAAGIVVAETKANGKPGEAAEFAFPRPELATRSELAAAVNSMSLFGSGLAYPPDFRLDGRARIDKGGITGWVTLGWLPQRPLEILAGDGTNIRFRVTAQPDPALPSRQSFSLEAPSGVAGNEIVIAAVLPDNSVERLPDSPLLLEIPPALPAPPRATRVVASKRQRALDIIVPVYGRCQETVACLKAVIATTRGRAEIVVVDDASPDQELAAALDRMASDRSITLLRNPTNQGFPAAVNRGLALHDERDVVLLNSDTVVRGNWLKRLRAAAYRAADIGTATPLTNAGSIASYPAGTEQNCEPADAARIDVLTARANRGVAVELPVGVGFCCFIRRDCLNEVGLLDAAAFAAGYGEEVDFCLRAAAQGWRHILAADVFILHAGARSFGEKRRRALLERSRRIISARYPDFERRIDAFEKADPIAPARRRLDEARLAAGHGRCVVLLTLALIGGVERFVRERAQELRREGLRPIIMKPVEPGAAAVMLTTDADTANDLRYDLPGELPLVQDLFARLDIAFFEVHHFADSDPRLVEAILGAAPVDIYIHDYSWVCPQTNLIDGTQRYCGEPTIAVCELCLAKNGSPLGDVTTVAALRARSQAWLAAARRVVVPSRDAARRLRRYFPTINPVVVPWEDTVAPREAPVPRGEATRIALIGAIGVHKGYNTLLACARDAAARNLPVEFVVIGYSADDDALIETGKVFVTGRYAEEEVEGLLAREQPHLLFFPSVWPETWCYALTHALRSGLTVIGFDLGAIAERLRAHRNGIVLPFTEGAGRLNDHFLRIAERSGRKPTPRTAYTREDAPQTFSSTMSSVPHPRSVVMPPDKPINATVQLLPLPKGLYSFSVKAAAPTRVERLQNLALPTVHVGIGPGTPATLVEFLAANEAQGPWLTEPGDILVLKLARPATILLTSLPSPGGQTLAIEVERMSNRNAATVLSGEAPAAVDQVFQVDGVTPLPPSVTIPLKINLHIRNQGDAAFVDADWAGRGGAGKWIEAMSLAPLSEISPSDIEYKGLTAAGVETPWISNGGECGTRGKATPLLGFAVRPRPTAMRAQVDCSYSGYFASGRVVGPITNGAPCRSNLKNDPLEGVQIRFLKRAVAVPAVTRPAEPIIVGPRFSKLREPETGEALAVASRAPAPAVKVPEARRKEATPRPRKAKARAPARAGAVPAPLALASASEATGVLEQAASGPEGGAD